MTQNFRGKLSLRIRKNENIKKVIGKLKSRKVNSDKRVWKGVEFAIDFGLNENSKTENVTSILQVQLSSLI